MIFQKVLKTIYDGGVIWASMAARTKTPHVKMTEKQYEELEELVERGEYTSKDEFA